MLRTDSSKVTQNNRMMVLAPLRSHYYGIGMYDLPRVWPVVDEVRLAAIGALGHFGADGAPAVKELDAILRTERDMTIRWFVAAAVNGIGPAARDAVPALIELLKSRDVAVLPPDESREDDVDNPPVPLRLAAAVALGGVGPPARAAVPDLVRSLADQDPTVRAEAAWALGEIGAEAVTSIPALVKLMEQEPDDLVADAAVHASGKIGAKAVPALAARVKVGDGDTRIRFVTALGEAGPDAAPAIRELAEAAVDPDEEVRTAAVEALGSIGKGPAGAAAIVPILIAALKDADSHVRNRAAWGLNRIGTKTDRVIGALISAVRDANGDVAAAADNALCHIGLPALPAIEALLRDADERMPARAVFMLSLLATSDRTIRVTHETPAQTPARLKAARSALISALKHPNADVRSHVADVLDGLDDSIIPEWIQAIGDDSSLIRTAAAEALGFWGPKATPALDALRKCLKDPDATLRSAAASAIEQIAKPNL